jgi:hypothetical protein
MFTLDNNTLNLQIKELGYKHGLTAEQSYDIAKHQFDFILDVMKTANVHNPYTFQSVNLQHFGKFVLTPKYIKLTEQLDKHEQLIRMVAKWGDIDIA